MTVTAQRLLTELGHRAWSGFNADDMVFESDDSTQAKAELNSALRYLINLQDFPFRAKEYLIETDVDSPNYKMVEGQITNIYNVDDFESLQFVGDNSTYDKEIKGKPTHYWIDYNNPKETVRFYPIPDAFYRYKVVYNQYMPVIDEKGREKKFEFEKANDFMNIPANLEMLFMDCLVLRTIITNMKDEQDENYRPTINEFNETWKVFIRSCKPAKIETKVVW